MPLSEQMEYNPNILGFVEDKGPVVISLKKAREIYGQLPSDYDFVSKKDSRQKKKGLNLGIGKLITEKLNEKSTNFKKIISDFSNAWHRDFKKEFNVLIDPFLNLNKPSLVKDILKTNQKKFSQVSGVDLRDFLAGNQLIRKDILNSIKGKDLFETTQRMLIRKQKSMPSGKKLSLVKDSLEKIRIARTLMQIKEETTFDIAQNDFESVTLYADEISQRLLELSGNIDMPGIHKIKGITGQNIAFEFASRDISYLTLGKETGDCTADKAHFQADQDVENIYWTVFPWILDQTYQILKVYYQGTFVMKAHLLPLFILHEGGDGDLVLAVDAIETVRAFRDDIKGYQRHDLLDNKSIIFNKLIEEIKGLGNRMGFDHIYAERFSNTKWVRERLSEYPEIFFHVNNIIKIDDLEDVFCLSQELCENANYPLPKEIFMEVQMKNTSLLPRVTSKMEGIKSFAIIKGNPYNGIPMKRVIGI